MAMRSCASVLLVALVATLLTTQSGVDARQLLQSNREIVWRVPEDGPAFGTITVAVGDTVTWTWTALHDLWQIPTGACPPRFSVGTAGMMQLAPTASSGRRAITFTTAGTFYYACSVSTHCQEGQMITVMVTGAIQRAAAAAPAPGPGGLPTKAPTAVFARAAPSEGGGYASNYGK